VKPGPYKLFILLAGFTVFTAVVLVRLVDLQVVKHSHYRDLHRDQSGEIERIPAKRGTIFDRRLRPLAMTLPAYRICADPSVISRPDGVADCLCEVLRSERRSLARRLSDRTDRYEVLERMLDFETALRIERMALPGIYLEPVGERVRPLGGVGQNVVGCFSDDGRPLGGVELMWDKVLKGTPGRRRFLLDALGNLRPCVGAILEEPVSGESVVLTIDSDLQSVAEEALDGAVREHQAKGGCVVVVDPWNGDILALASNPRGLNFPVRTVFEPGSAFKIVTFACALDLGKVDTTDVYDTNGGVLKVRGGTIRDDHPHEILNLIEAFAFSSNVVAAMIARKIGEMDFYRYIRAFGFGLRTGIGLEGESAGILREPEEWSGRSLESLAFGQEIGVTAIQLAMAYAAIANGGKLLKPRLVQAVVDEDGNVMRRYPAKAVRTVIREDTSREITRLLESVVQGGTGVPASIDGIHVAGKTGTGQKAECGRYISGKLYSVFAGFIPSANPRYVCLVVIDEPSGRTHYGGWVCGPVFKALMESLLRRDKRLVPATSMRLAWLEDEADGDGGATAAAKATAPDVYPSVVGLTLREAGVNLAAAGIRWRAHGSGKVIRQRPAAFTVLDQSPVCDLFLCTTK
jgi:cell division protein FtsI/penicillin-binding protein 2